MARPITWQDVAAPNLGSSLAAAAQAGQQITQAIAGLGNVVSDYGDTTKAEATKKAVAGILTAADPLAAAASTPQGWQIDPLAVAQAAQQGDARIRANRASDASLEASQASTALNKLQLEDATSTRQAASLASPLIDQIVKTGKLPSIDLNKDDWKSAAGNKAYGQVLDFWNKYQDDKRATEALYWQRKSIMKSEAEQNFLGFAREFGASAEGQTADPAEWDRKLTAEAKKRGVSVALVDQALQFAERGAQSSRPTDSELDTEVPNVPQSQDLDGNNRPATTYLDAQANLRGRISDLNAQKAFEQEKFQGAVQGRDLMAGNVFTGPVAGIPAKLATAKGWNEEDAQEAIQAIRAEYPGLDAAQAADIALAHGGKWFETRAARSDKAKAMAGKYQAFNDAGRAEGLQRNLDSVASKFDRAIARVNVLNRQVSGAARTGAPIPTEAANIIAAYRANADAKEKADREAKAAAEKAAAEAAAQQAKDRAEADAALQRAFERK